MQRENVINAETLFWEFVGLPPNSFSERGTKRRARLSETKATILSDYAQEGGQIRNTGFLPSVFAKGYAPTGEIHEKTRNKRRKDNFLYKMKKDDDKDT
ncbi:MAG: hypothetical protein P9L91_00010 [Candidatus Zophobacter franzmannii]|nr:hypothetical protein [Candidatus Zophobacter franzmannii]